MAPPPAAVEEAAVSAGGVHVLALAPAIAQSLSPLPTDWSDAALQRATLHVLSRVGVSGWTMVSLRAQVQRVVFTSKSLQDKR